MRRPVIVLYAALLAAACSAPAAGSPSPTVAIRPTLTAPATPTAPTPTTTASPAATVSATAIPLPSTATLSAPTGTVVWMLLANTHLFRSSDRGATWEGRTVPLQVPVGGIAFVDEREGWLSSPGSPATQCQSQAVAIWHTSDGAATWERLYQSDVATDAMCKDSPSYADAQHGYLTLWSPNGAPVIARTSDGGRSWTRSQPLPDPPGFATQVGSTLRPGRVKAAGSILLVDAIGGGAGNGLTYAFRSTDGGVTWSYASTGPTRGADAIVFVTGTRWLQIVPPNNSKETTDGGATWHPYVTDYQQAAPIAPQIVFGDAQVGYATVRGAIQRTTDGGAHWTALKTPGT